MASTFIGVSISNSGLNSSKVALSVTNNNIANVNTEGYSRQTVSQVAAGAAAVYSGSGVLGGGAEVTSVDRERNWRLDQSYWRQNSDQNAWQTKSDTLSEVESIFGEPSESGFSTVMKNFSDSLESLSKNAGDSSVRTTVESYGEALCQYFNDTAANLVSQREGVNQDLRNTVEQINSNAEQLASLNKAISQAKASGASAIELEDRRDLLLDELSSLTGVKVTQTTLNGNEENPLWTVSLGDQVLVNGDQYNTLACQDTTGDGMYEIYWDDGEEFTAYGGTLAAELDLRDGDGTGTNYKGIVYYQNELDNFASTFAQNFNDVHNNGYPLNSAVVGGDFFAQSGASAADYTTLTAANICVSADIQSDVSLIAAAGSATTGNTNKSDNTNILALTALLESADCMGTGKGTPEDALNAIITTLGTTSSYAKRMADNSDAVLETIDSRRKSVSGVSTNEEASNLTKYEEAYSASAQALRTWSDIYATTLTLLDE